MKKIFEFERSANVRRSAFDLSHERKLSLSMGKLYPILVEETVPNDKFSISSEVFIRFAPMVAPIMHRIDAYVHYFFVPNRIIWEEWEKFITGDLATVTPHYDVNGVTIPIGSLADYMGVPPYNYATAHEDINALPFRAYWKIYNDYYRDQDLQTELDIDTIEAGNPLLSEVLIRNWEKDYFTTARPWLQKGNPISVHVDQSFKSSGQIEYIDGTNVGTGDDLTTSEGAGNAGDLKGKVSGKGMYISPFSSLSTDISELRVAVRVQEFLERKARTGSRYAEFLMSFFGRRSEDARLQRAEYLGGGKTACVISEVLNTNGRADTDADALPQGNMSGHGIAVGNTNRAVYSVPEHGWIIGLLSVMPQCAYHQGLHRKFSRAIYTDYLIPQFATISEQVIRGKEILFNADNVNNADDFGYQSRFAEYKSGFSTVHGDFRGNMDHYHLARKFGSAPSLNEDFIKCVPDTRIFAVESGDNLWCQVYNHITAVRPLPFFDQPGL